jgi:hypothetical protein
MAKASNEPQFGPNHSMFNETSQVPLYEGATLSRLVVTLLIFNYCRTHGTSIDFINEMLHLLKMSMLPQPNILFFNEYEASNTLKKLELAYIIIHACPKGHILFRGQYENDQSCSQCGLIRYKLVGKSLVPQKVLKHFPIIPRLKRMYSTPKQTSLMTWYIKNRSGDGMMHHDVDSRQWFSLTKNSQILQMNHVNIHLGLMTNGINPFAKKHSTWSTWPINISEL